MKMQLLLRKFLFLICGLIFLCAVAEGNTKDRGLGINTDFVIPSSVGTPFFAAGFHSTFNNHEFNLAYGQDLNGSSFYGERVTSKAIKGGYKKNFTRVFGISWMDIVFSGNISYTRSKHDFDFGKNYLTTSGLLGVQFHITDVISANLFPAGIAYSKVMDQGRGHIMQNSESSLLLPRGMLGLKFNFYQWD